MTLNDPLANAMSSILHSEKIGRTTCVIKPVSAIIKQALGVLNEQKYIGACTEVRDRKGSSLKVNLLGAINKCGVVKPRFSVSKDSYEKFEQRYLPARDMGILVVSTNKGMMTNIEAKKKNIGGKLIAYCY
jgi:small subunit ribosomal protein S8